VTLHQSHWGRDAIKGCLGAEAGKEPPKAQNPSCLPHPPTPGYAQNNRDWMLRSPLRKQKHQATALRTYQQVHGLGAIAISTYTRSRDRPLARLTNIVTSCRFKGTCAAGWATACGRLSRYAGADFGQRCDFLQPTQHGLSAPELVESA